MFPTAISLTCDIIVAVVVTTEFGLAEYRHMVARPAAMNTQQQVPPRPRIVWPFVALAATALISTFTYLGSGTPSQQETFAECSAQLSTALKSKTELVAAIHNERWVDLKLKD